jgi:Spy/CpxP family protein refolding chaperone
MKKLQFALVAAMLVGGTTVAAAQDAQPQGRQGGRPNMMAMLMTGITLTADQQVKVDSINKKFDDARATLRADQSLEMDARRAKGRELQTKQADEVKALLTADQKMVFEKNQADAAARMQQGGGRPPRA